MHACHRSVVLGLAVCLLGAAAASALTVNGAGTVLDGWNVTPFTGGPTPGVATHDGMTSYYQNNWAPIHYPSVGHVPSPGYWRGEAFDLEEMHIRQTGTFVEMLLVASSAFQASSSGSTFNLGDVLLDFDGEAGWDVGLVTQSSNNGLESGGLYGDIDTLGLQPLHGSYHGTWVESAIGGWAVEAGDLLASTDIETASHDYGDREDQTHLYQFGFDLDDLPGAIPTSLVFQMAWGCGNDVIGGTFTVAEPPVIDPGPGAEGDVEPPSTSNGAVPEPLSAGLNVLAMASLAMVLTGRSRGGNNRV